MALTARDQELVVKAFQCAKGGEIQVDYVKFAEAAGFKNTNSAAAVWNSVKKKLFALGTPADGSTSATTTPTKPATKKRKADNNEGGGDDTSETPTKTPAKRGRKAKDDEESSTKAKTPRKKTVKSAARIDENDTDAAREAAEDLNKENEAAVQKILESVNGVFKGEPPNIDSEEETTEIKPSTACGSTAIKEKIKQEEEDNIERIEAAAHDSDEENM